MEVLDTVWNFVRNNFGTITISGVIGAVLGPNIVHFWNRVWKRIGNNDDLKRELHKKVLGIVSEGRAHHFQVKPRDEEHIEAVINELGQVDRKAADLLRRFHTGWFIAEGAFAQSKIGPAYIDQYHEFEMGTVDNATKLLERIKKWK